MTTIIATESAEGVTFGWDSLTSVGWNQFEGEEPKVFAHGGIIFGIAGNLLDASIIRHAELPNPEQSGWDIDRWVIRELVPAIVARLKERDTTKITNAKIETGNHSLICVKNRIYQLFADTSILRRKDGVYLIGSGAEYARGALSAGAEIIGALAIAAKHDGCTGGELHTATADELLAVD